jgi:hypothetical protein
MAQSSRQNAAWRSLLLLLLLCFATAAGPTALEAQSADSNPDPQLVALRAEIADLRQAYERRLADLEARLASFEQARPTVAVPVPSPAPAAAPVAAPASPTGTQSANYFNPAISLISNFLGAGGDNRAGLPNAALRESELGLRAIIDPYAKADVFLAFGEEGVELEEGYVTFTALPAQWLAKAGRMRVNFGKVNTYHLHSLPWPDLPLPAATLLGEEGWIGSGISVARLLPIGDTFSELTVEALRPDAPGLFASDDAKKLAWNAHYRLFRDLGESANLDLGLSLAEGPNGVTPDSRTQLRGFDVTYRWKPLRQSRYRGAVVRGEIFDSRRETATTAGIATQEAFGWFASADYRLARRWWLGTLLEQSERPSDPHLRDRASSLLLSFSPSEFLQLRGQLRRGETAEGERDIDLLLQLQFLIGAHGAHPF